ncbi:hypothetical protein GCM10009555_017510 [Acrocarpospora macrocephala]|uniref:Uncharacterized protein n=1 Tax=Acrocarpospora macrocephala TaxID=150177 RepID=A0A5M3WJP4_9ACTN|nr:hypothetical protein [Acrocarpospora macrocephala]GES07411.1 hypothetical protein Amac_010060 [Acrocarpospora macrocephala]
MAQLRLRRTRDGVLRIDGDVPDDHYFSAGWIADRIAAGEAEVTVTLNVEGGPVTWRLAGLENEDGSPAKSSWHVVRDGE